MRSVKDKLHPLRARGGPAGQQLADAIETLESRLNRVSASSGTAVVDTSVDEWQNAPLVSSLSVVSTTPLGNDTVVSVKYLPAPASTGFAGVLLSAKYSDGRVEDLTYTPSVPGVDGYSVASASIPQSALAGESVTLYARAVAESGGVAAIVAATPSVTISVPAAGLGDIPGLTLLSASLAADDPVKNLMTVSVQAALPSHPSIMGCDVYLALPASGDVTAPPVQFGLPGWLRYVGTLYGRPSETITGTISLEAPSNSYFGSLTGAGATTRVGYAIYVVPRTTDIHARLVPLTAWSPASPSNASPYQAGYVDWVNFLDARSLVGVHVSVSIYPGSVTVTPTSSGFTIRGAFMPPPANGGSITGVRVYSCLKDVNQNVFRGEFPYTGFGSAYPDLAGWFEFDVPTPATMPTTMMVQVVGNYTDGFETQPQRIFWEVTGPLPGESYTNGRALITLDAAPAAPSISGATVEYQKGPDGQWQYRVAATLSGAVLTQDSYGGSDIRLRFSTEVEDWPTTRIVAHHSPGDPSTVRTPWYDIRPGTTAQFYLRAESLDTTSMTKAWSAIAGPFTVSLALGGTIPGVGSAWNLSATLVGYTSDGNGVLLGQVQVSWTPLSTPGLVYGIWEYRSASATPPAYSSYTKTEANTSSGSLTMWIRPPAADLEYLHLALTASDPAQGLWPKPTDYPAGQLPVVTVTLPRAGLPNNVTGFTVTVGTDQSSDVPIGWYEYAFTPPAGDANWDGVHIYRRPADSLGNPIAPELPEPVARIRTGGKGGTWPLPPATEYWIFRCASVNPLRQEQTSGNPTVFVTVPAAGGVTASKAKSGFDLPVISATLPGATYLGAQIVYYNGHVYTWRGTAYVEDADATWVKQKLQANGLTTAEFASGYAPVVLYGGVPPAYFIGNTVYDTVNSRLYRWTGSGYARAMSGADIKAELAVDKLTANEISANSITSGLIASGAITTTQLAGNEISVGPVSGSPPRFVVKDSGGVTIGAIGEWSGFTGLWAANAKFGGTFSAPKISLSSSAADLTDVNLTVSGSGAVIQISPSVGLVATQSGTGSALKVNSTGISVETGVHKMYLTGQVLQMYNGASRFIYISNDGVVELGSASPAPVRIDANSAVPSVTIWNGRLQIASYIMIDENHRFRFHDVLTEAIALSGATTSKTVAAYGADGSYIGKIPII